MTIRGLAACLALLVSVGATGAETDRATSGEDEEIRGVRVSFGGSARGRWESWDGFRFGAAPKPDDGFGLIRLLAHADARVSKRSRLYAELKSSLVGDRELPGGARPVDADAFDLHQGFVDVTLTRGPGPRVVFRAGRQALSFGRQRLVSPLPWGNTLRAWDGLGVTVDSGSWRTDVFWTRPVNVLDRRANEADSGREFWGAYASRDANGSALEVYLLGLERKQAAFNGTSGGEHRKTLGGRWSLPQKGARPGVEVEAAYQLGSVAARGIDAWMLAVGLDRSVPGWRGKPKFSLLLDAASGDRTPGGSVQTFNQLFPLGHAYFGIADQLGRQNIAAAALSAVFQPHRSVRVVLTAHAFGRLEREDALYDVGGAPLLPGAAGSSRESGYELDGVVRWRAHDLTVEVGLAVFDPGRFVERRTPGERVTFGYTQVEFAF